MRPGGMLLSQLASKLAAGGVSAAKMPMSVLCLPRTVDSRSWREDEFEEWLRCPSDCYNSVLL